MKINIIIPYKENFNIENASSVSIVLKNSLKKSKFKSKFQIFGRNVKNPMFKKSFNGVKKPFYYLGSKNILIARYLLKSIKLDRNEKQIIEVHNRPYVFAFIANKIRDIPITLFFHNNPLEMKGSKSISEREEILKRAKRIFFVSKYIKKQFLIGIKYSKNENEKLIVLYNGITRNVASFPKKKKEVLFVGRIVKEKGAHLYVDAVDFLASKFPDWKFIICGSPKLGHNDTKSIYASSVTQKFLDIGVNTLFTGYLKNDEILKKMANASIVVVPSLWDEPYGLVVSEAMSSGCAVISTNSGGIPEILKGNGILIKNINKNKLINKMTLLINNSEELKKFQQLAWKNFSHTSDNYNQLLDQHRIQILKNF